MGCILMVDQMNKSIVIAVGSFFANCSFGASFGVFEPKALAMGGATVAVSSIENAQFYNPALLAFHDEDEDTKNIGRFYLPTSSVQIPEAAFDIQDIDDDQLVDRLSDSVDQFNADTTIENASLVSEFSEDLVSSLNSLTDSSLSLDAFAGISLVEPGNRQGGGFYLGVRGLGGGSIDITQQDLDLLNDYSEGLEFIASAGTRGEAHPELFNGDGTLIDPRANLTSRASAVGAAALEVGVSFAYEYDLWGQPVAFGLTPKFSTIFTYEAILDIQNNNVITEDSEQRERILNLDVGVASYYGPWALGIAVKDVFEQSIDTELGNEVNITSKPRLGLAYRGERFQIGLDYDLVPIKPLGTESDTQEIALGVNWQVWRSLSLRAGFRQDQASNTDSQLSAGFGFRWRRFLMDAAISESADSRAAAMQIGWTI